MAEEPGRSHRRLAAVVFNPVKVPVDALRDAVARAERENGWAPTEWFETAEHDSGTAAARAAIATAPDVVLVAGGDGTVRAVAQEIYRSGVPLALLPAGTGNLLARNLHLTLSDLSHAVHTAFTGADRSIDIAFAATRTAERAVVRRAFLVMAGIGLDANMAANTNPALKKRIGWIAYTDPIARSVLGNKQVHLHYRIDGGRPHALRAHTVIAGNCGTLTANILLLPDAVVDDGLLDVVVFRPKGPFGWARVGSRLATNGLFHRFRSGRWLMQRTPDLKGLNYVQARRFDVRFAAPQLLQLDGDIIGEVTEVALTVLRQSLTLRVPREDVAEPGQESG
ncbi:diacylglycerol/lipid kinase family protein [Herbiconiux sp. P16]|uniref:diacylglycerol/lipid kinase family protein n=1 Tax=Herbiconiux wuyangfengii TaxID=3342794 RepID=UPI0035BA3905